jgi:hypothetical protein
MVDDDLRIGISGSETHGLFEPPPAEERRPERATRAVMPETLDRSRDEETGADDRPGAASDAEAKPTYSTRD